MTVLLSYATYSATSQATDDMGRRASTTLCTIPLRYGSYYCDETTRFDIANIYPFDPLDPLFFRSICNLDYRLVATCASPTTYDQLLLPLLLTSSDCRRHTSNLLRVVQMLVEDRERKRWVSNHTWSRPLLHCPSPA
jgi:hypothetical protein